jgi:hypothetical protein
MTKTLISLIICVLIAQLHAQNGFYKHLKGKIGKYPITMDLTKTNKGLATDIILIGAYSYDNAEGLMLINGQLKGDSLVFFEKYNMDETGRFALKQVDESSFVGTWTNKRTKKVLKVTLNEDYTEGSVRFDYKAKCDSTDFFKIAKDSLGKPRLKIKWDGKIISSLNLLFERRYLIPKNVSKSLNDSIFNIESSIGFDKVRAEPISIDDLFPIEKSYFEDTSIEAFMENYKKDWQKDTIRELREYFFYEQPDSRTTYVLCNDGHFLTIAYFIPLKKYGNHIRTYVFTIDNKSGKILRGLEDFLKKEQNLREDIEKDVRKAFGVSKPEDEDTDESSEVYFPYMRYTNPIGYGDIGITSKGIFLAGYKRYFGHLPWVLNWSTIKLKVQPAFYDSLKIK